MKGSPLLPVNAIGRPDYPRQSGTGPRFYSGFNYVKIRITAIEEKSRAELETWKREAAGELRRDSVNRSRSTLKGKIAEQMAPVLPDFCYAFSDARVIGSPVDYVIFDGLTRVADDKSTKYRLFLWMSGRRHADTYATADQAGC